MILKKVLRQLCHSGAALAILSSPALAKSPADEAFLGAFDAYRAGDAMRFSRHAARLEQHVLAPWIEYWRLEMQLEDAPASEVEAFLARNADTFVAERLRGDWLKVLGKRADWQAFEAALAGYPREDLELRCYRWSSRIARGDETALAEAAAMWLEPRELPEGCVRLVDTKIERGRIGPADVWPRVRVLFENGQITAAKSALGYLPRKEAPDERSLTEAARQPKRVLERLPESLQRRAVREVVVLAAVRNARTDPEAVATALEGRLGKALPASERKYLWGRVGYEAARKHHEEALKWYARAGNAELSDEQLAWKVRAALRRGHWRTVREAIDRMSAQASRDPAWIYWYGRALAAQGEKAGAEAYWLRIAGQTDFYGLLANEELGFLSAVPGEGHVPAEEEVAAAQREPGLARALELFRLGLRTEGVREWFFSIRGLDDRRLLAAAELAYRAEIYDRAINTADRTTTLHNFSLRYPVPFREVFGEFARTNGLEEAWVFGLVRQESRFIADARSSAGARGLMQVMPATARYVARKIGLRNYQPGRMAEVQTNVTLGTGYLRMVLDQLGHPVLASAAYNAGPGRARRWRDERPLEGAIYAETIPFAETRDYVKKVMANAVFYEALLEGRLTSLKARLGTVPSRDGTEAVGDEKLP
jgi:soluble lytic murein transglycosylase